MPRSGQSPSVGGIAGGIAGVTIAVIAIILISCGFVIGVSFYDENSMKKLRSRGKKVVCTVRVERSLLYGWSRFYCAVQLLDLQLYYSIGKGTMGVLHVGSRTQRSGPQSID